MHQTAAAILDFVIFYLNANISETIQQNSIFFFAMFLSEFIEGKKVFLILTNFLLVPKVMDIFCLPKFTIFSEFCLEIEKMFQTKIDGKFSFTIKNVFLSSKNLSKYFLSNKNQIGISNFIKKNHLQSEKRGNSIHT
jgi:hypothetical protein